MAAHPPPPSPAASSPVAPTCAAATPGNTRGHLLDGRENSWGYSLDGRENSWGHSLGRWENSWGHSLDGRGNSWGHLLDGRGNSWGHLLEGRENSWGHSLGGRENSWGHLTAQLHHLVLEVLEGVGDSMEGCKNDTIVKSFFCCGWRNRDSKLAIFVALTFGRTSNFCFLSGQKKWEKITFHDFPAPVPAPAPDQPGVLATLLVNGPILNKKKHA